jgi:hypothetical protein
MKYARRAPVHNHIADIHTCSNNTLHRVQKHTSLFRAGGLQNPPVTMNDILKLQCNTCIQNGCLNIPSQAEHYFVAVINDHANHVIQRHIISIMTDYRPPQGIIMLIGVVFYIIVSMNYLLT